MKSFRVLIVGAGQMGRHWGRILRDCPDTEVVAWVDTVPGAAEHAVEEHEMHGVFTEQDLDRAIAGTRPDFVVDVTPPEAHHAVTLLALARGLPVLGEKPMAATMDEARELVAASESAGALFMVSQNRRFDANLHELRRIIAQHTGPVGVLNADYFMGEHLGGFRREMGHPLLLDMGIHTFDAARFLTGADALSVYCMEFNPPWSWYAGGACATAIFELTSGATFSYRGSRCADGFHTTWDAEWRAVGPRGTALWDGHSAPVAEVVVEPGEPFANLKRLDGTPDIEMACGLSGTLRAFLRALESGATPPCECHDNIKSLAMVHAAIESAATGRRVAVQSGR